MTKIKIVGFTIFIVSLLLTYLFSHISFENKINNKLLDVINEQKAFTQEISKNIFYIHKNREASSTQLDDSIKKFIQRMNDKSSVLDPIESVEITAKIDEIIILWNRFYLDVQKFREQSRVTTAYSNIVLEKIVKDIYTTNLDLVIEFNTLIKLHQEQFDKTLETYKNLQYTLFILLVLQLIYLFTQLQTIIAFIQKFLNTSNDIIDKSSIKDLEPITVKTNSSELLEASDNFNLLVQRIDEALVHANKSIDYSAASLESLESNIEDFLDLMSEMEENKELSKKEDALIQTLEELSNCKIKMTQLKSDLNTLVKHQ